MGGSFDPFHLAHFNSLLTVKESFKIDQILLIPSFKTPLKNKTPSSSASHRLSMLKKMASSYPFIEIDDQEILRKGLSYTYQTIQELSQKRKKEELFFIMGLDQFLIFDQWKNYENILKKTHLIVTSRPRLQFPQKRSEFSKKLQPFIKNASLKSLEKIKKISYKQGFKDIYFLALNDKDISSCDIRQKIKNKESISHLIPQKIKSYIEENQLYEDNENQKIDFIKEELEAKKGFHIECYDLRTKPLPFSFVLIASASNTRQTKTLALHIKKKLKERFDVKPLGEEGSDSSRWIVLDYGDILLHLFYDHTRAFYNLEELWTKNLNEKASMQKNSPAYRKMKS